MPEIRKLAELGDDNKLLATQVPPDLATAASVGAEADARVATDTALDGRLDAVETALPDKAAAADVTALTGRVGAVETALPDKADTAALTAGLAGKVDTGDARLTNERTPADGSVTTAKLAPRAVTWAKAAAVSTARILGRKTTGSGDVEELAAADVRTMLGAGQANGLATLDADGKVPAAQTGSSATVQVGDRRYVYASETPQFGTGVGTWAVNTSYPFGMRRAWSSQDGHSIGYDLHLTAGTYTVELFLGKASNHGIIDVTLGGVTVVTGLDLYAASLTMLQDVRTGIVVPTSGMHRLLQTTNGQNGSSSGRAAAFAAACIHRTS